MALSRTARILIAILLLAAAAFFWVNFFVQGRVAQTPAQDPVAANPPVPTPSAATPSAPDVATEPADAAAPGAAPTASTQTDADAATEAEAAGDPEAVAGTPAGSIVVVVQDPPAIAIDAPVAVSRDVVIADLPFLVTSPPLVAIDVEPEGEEGDAPGAVTVPTRATINPFSPVVVRTPPPPDRDVPQPGNVVGEVPVPAAPAGAVTQQATAAVRAPTPTPRPLAPATTVAAGLTRELPTGTVLSSTPDLLRSPRVGTVADRVDLPAITAIAVPAAEPVTIAPPPTPRAPIPQVDLRPVGPIAIPVATTDEPTIVVDDAATDGTTGVATSGTTAGAPLPAGTTQLARYLRDYDYAFTGSVMGPVSVGVFRSQADPTPIVVALGQTLPNTEIVLTDLRGMQAELTLGDSTQILSLDLRR
jgi:hypothetical protein